MSKRHVVAIAAGISLLLMVVILAIALSRQQLRRHRVFRDADRAAAAPKTIPPVGQWSATFPSLAPDALADLLARIERQQPDQYAAWSLGYPHARTLIEEGELDEAAARLRPFLALESPFRDLAIYHQSQIEEARGNRDAASSLRQELIFAADRSPYRQRAVEEEIVHLASLGDPQPLIAFGERVAPSLPTRERRELNARAVESLMRSDAQARGVALALSILNGGTTDDAADRAARAVDRPEILRSLTPEQLALLGETFQSHRHFDRAAALLSLAIPRLPRRADELRFGLGRSHFGNEQYDEAQRIYTDSARLTRDMRWKATFLWHAARAAQLRGDDRTGEQLMTAAIAVRGNFPATNAALTQRIRTRAKQRRLAEAAGDLQLLRRIAPNSRATVEGALALALGQLGAGNTKAALAVLDSVPRRLLDAHDRAELDYWRARALEATNLPAAFEAYLSVLRSTAPTHFAYFATDRLDSSAMAGRMKQELERREADVAKLVAAQDFVAAKRAETDRILLSSAGRTAEVARLADIYRELPAYRRILELEPEPFPSLPLDEGAGRASLLMALGMFDEATGEIRERWPLSDVRSALTQSLALNRGNASRESIHAVEIMMRSVPNDYLPDLLPAAVRRLLYPRYFYDAIVRDAERFGADPRLVLSIMREESRFDPRAKSPAAARGLLQFIITTARDIGRDIGLVEVSPEDLYDPRTIIGLGAKYVATLSDEFDGNRYHATAAYNAGPNQVRLWTRLAAGADEDYFLSAVNFDETKHYVRKVMNSYKRYGEIYEQAPPAGGVTIEP
ncbi:MAG TPA: lytic transglycosylase domain-containing protein [Thermoanaerobaculia bacterium]|nr:lytic transglycosylase domain-containing protein [Thermoanaerobaculia bacterium]